MVDFTVFLFVEEITRKAPARGGVEDRLQSQTGPVYGSNNKNLNSRYPQIKGAPAAGGGGGGGITRRTGNALPTKRPQQTQTLPMSNNPMISVSGIGGVRVIRAGRT
jgi:hypothetical protein